MYSLSWENQVDISEALNSYSRNLDDLLHIDNSCLEQIINKNYLIKIWLN